jgi:hypothetical protein
MEFRELEAVLQRSHVQQKMLLVVTGFTIFSIRNAYICYGLREEAVRVLAACRVE